MPSFFSASTNVTQRPPTAAQRAVELRHKVHKLRPIATVPEDPTDRSWVETKRHAKANSETTKPSLILSGLLSELHFVGDDPARQLQAHRHAFELIARASDATTGELLSMIYNAYERSTGKGSADTYNLLLQKKEEADRENCRFAAENERMRRQLQEMELGTINMDRKLRRRTEQLLELAAQHNIPLHFADEGMSFDSQTRTMGEIRGYQDKLRAKVLGLDGKEALSREHLMVIDKQLAAECEAVDAELNKLGSLDGVVAAQGNRHAVARSRIVAETSHYVRAGEGNTTRRPSLSVPAAFEAAIANVDSTSVPHSSSPPMPAGPVDGDVSAADGTVAVDASECAGNAADSEPCIDEDTTLTTEEVYLIANAGAANVRSEDCGIDLEEDADDYV